MPITPFHFGPGLLLHSAAPGYVSFLAFCAANVLIDLESLYNLVYRHQPVHAFFHTYVGATLVIATVGALFVFGRWFASRFWLPDLFRWRALSLRQVLLGAALGGYSHVALDSLMHRDMRPLWPFAGENFLLGLSSLGGLHIACLASGVVGLLVMATRWFVLGGHEARR